MVRQMTGKHPKKARCGTCRKWFQPVGWGNALCPACGLAQVRKAAEAPARAGEGEG